MSLIACNKTCAQYLFFNLDFFGINITLRTFWWTWPHLRTLARTWAVLYLLQRRVCLGVVSIRYLRVAILLLGTGLGQHRIGLPIPKTSDQCPARGRWLPFYLWNKRTPLHGIQLHLIHTERKGPPWSRFREQDSTCLPHTPAIRSRRRFRPYTHHYYISNTKRKMIFPA